MNDMFEKHFKQQELPLEIRRLYDLQNTIESSKQSFIFLALHVAEHNVEISESTLDMVYDMDILQGIVTNTINAKTQEYLKNVKKG